MKKCISLLLSCVLLISLIPMSVLAAEPSGIPITTADELKAMESGKNYYLTNDITISGEWVGRDFANGTFDGNGHTVYLDGATLVNGLFGYLDQATVQNLTVAQKNEIVAKTNGDTYPGETFGILARSASGWSTPTQIINVKILVDIPGVVSHSGTMQRIGGFIGTVRYRSAHFINCTYSGSISGTSTFGDESQLTDVGGYVGETYAGARLVFENCAVYGSLSGKYAGGLLGVGRQSDDGGTIESLKAVGNINYAEIVAKDAENAAGMIAYAALASGCVAEIRNNINYGSVTNSTNGSKVGGIAGNIKTFDNVTLTVSGNINYGTLSGATTSPIVANQYGGSTTKTAENNYTADLTYVDNEAPIPAKGEAQILTDEALPALRAAYPDTFCRLANGKITLKWAAAKGYADTLPTETRVSCYASQLSAKTEDGKRSVRFVGVLKGIEDLNAMDAVGMQICVADGAEGVGNLWIDSTTTVYTSVLAEGEEKLATEFGGDYLFTATLSGIPESAGTVTFEIRVFSVLNGCVNYRADAVTVTLTLSAAGN